MADLKQGQITPVMEFVEHTGRSLGDLLERIVKVERRAEETIVGVQNLDGRVNAMGMKLCNLEATWSGKADQLVTMEVLKQEKGRLEKTFETCFAAVGPMMREHIAPVTNLVGHMGNNLEGLLQRLLGLEQQAGRGSPLPQPGGGQGRRGQVVDAGQTGRGLLPPLQGRFDKFY